MSFTGIVHPEQIAMLRRVLGEHRAEKGSTDPDSAMRAAEQIMALFASGVECPKALAEALRARTRSHGYASRSASIDLIEMV